MRVTSFGLFWRQSEIDWNPGKGVKGSFRLLGRVGQNAGTLKIVDFRHQQGIYVLYDEYGPTYVGLTRKQGLGKRLKDHLGDRHAGAWDRFSWFGFTEISEEKDATGLLLLSSELEEVTEDRRTTIGDLEALLIQLMNPRDNVSKMNFAGGERWYQIPYDDIERYMSRVA
jgi:hypothetical protein